MASNYDRNRWETYNEALPNEDQPHSFITKRKLDKIEEGIEKANIPLEVGEVDIGINYGVTITENLVQKTRKLNVTFPMSLSGGSGVQGNDGMSAYEVWLDAGNTGTVQEYLNYLKGSDGRDGRDGRDGEDGAQGPAGDSAYQSWISLGNSGTEEDFIESLTGKSAYEVWKSIPGNENKSITEFFDSLKSGNSEEIIIQFN